MNKPMFDCFQIKEFTGLHVANRVLFTASFDPDSVVGETIRDMGDKITYFHDCDQFPNYGKKYAIRFDTNELKQIATKMAEWIDMDNAAMRESIAIFFGMTFATVLQHRQFTGVMYVLGYLNTEGKHSFIFRPDDTVNHKSIHITVDNKLLNTMMKQMQHFVEKATLTAKVYAIRSRLNQDASQAKI